MKSSFSDVTMWSSLLLLLPSLVLVRPSPKSANFRNWRIKNGMAGQTKRWTNDTTTIDFVCVAPGAQAISAPSTNVWSSLTSVEAAFVAAWLFAQPSLNLTSIEDAGEWDNSL
jgi:primary-amine oxidase